MTRVAPAGGRLLLRRVVAPHKSQDILIGALTRTSERLRTCTIRVGSNHATAPDFVADLGAPFETHQLATSQFRWRALEGAALDAPHTGARTSSLCHARTEVSA
jgi:hypothetical protein